MQSRQNSLGKKIGDICVNNIVWVLLIVSVIVMGLFNQAFYKPAILINIITQTTVLGIFTIAMSMAIILGDINLSVVGTSAFSAVIATSLMQYNGVSWVAAIFICVAIGLGIGILNGIIITKLRAVALIETLAMNMILTGAVLAITQGKSVTDFPDAYKFIGQGRIFGDIPVLPIVLIIAYGIFWVIWKKTRYGRSLFAVGGNSQSAFVAGINVDKVKISAFAISGLMCGVAGYLLSSYMGAVTTSFGGSYEMNCIAASVIGGVSLSGGKGSIVGILGGALLLTVIQVGLQLLGIESFYVTLAGGLMVFVAVLIDAIRNMITEKR
ncbi:MAG: ABC transporter permease [Christensenella sp.]